jgi:hypothetical protein
MLRISYELPNLQSYPRMAKRMMKGQRRSRTSKQKLRLRSEMGLARCLPPILEKLQRKWMSLGRYVVRASFLFLCLLIILEAAPATTLPSQEGSYPANLTAEPSSNIPNALLGGGEILIYTVWKRECLFS